MPLIRKLAVAGIFTDRADFCMPIYRPIDPGAA